MSKTKGKQARLLEKSLVGRLIDPAELLGALRLAPGGSWMTAQEVAAQVVGSAFKVAFALRRLAEDGLVEEDVVEVVGTARPREHRRLYRARPAPGEVRRVETPYPAWLCPQVVVGTDEGRRVEGSAGMRRWDRTDSQC